MLTDHHVQTLRAITSLEALLSFVRRELHWPIAEDDIENVTYEFEPEELGLKPEHTPKINSIRQLRPPSSDQPWGIFFIDFENKKIPVTVMRRILNHLAVKRRPQGLSVAGKSWSPSDLLFLTTYGQESEGAREVAFAHFHESPGDLPTLRVIDWDGQDTPAKLKETYVTLRDNLSWPEETTNAAAWRSQWAAPFRHKPGHTIRTAKELAIRLAELSKSIRERCNQLLAAETEKGPLTKLFKAFQEALIHDLKPDDFADTFSQTISYGLLTAAISRTPEPESGEKTLLMTEDAANLVPITNPFLKEILETFIDVGGRKKAGMDFDELGVQDVVDLLRGGDTDLAAVIRDFGNKKPGEDPVIHFYEDYLKAYDKALKVKRGVFYTPQPVVSYIVRSVHELLQAEFGLPDGLASTITWREMVLQTTSPLRGEVGELGEPGEGHTEPIKIPEGTDPDSHFVKILDPATGTGTFLVEVIDIIHKTMVAKWKAAGKRDAEILELWNDYVPDHLLPRLYGYELMMAPYAIAHMKMGLKLGETGYRFGSSARVRVYLTNALEPGRELAPRLIVDWEALAHEAIAVKAVKEAERFTVVIGNPPYSGHSSNASKDKKGNRNFIGNLVNDYYFVDGVTLGEKNPKYLQDDYVKFLRFGQYLIQQTGVGVLSMITNHGYLNNPTFRGMRWSLMQSFDELRFLDLHGNTKKKEVARDGSQDENVFDIMQGVAVCTLASRTGPYLRADRLCHFDLYGTRQGKYDALTSLAPMDGRWQKLDPNRPFFLFERQDQDLRTEYSLASEIPMVFAKNGEGFKSHRDDFAIAFTEQEARTRLEDFLSGDRPDVELREEYGLVDTGTWSLQAARSRLTANDRVLRQCLYRPFDIRTCMLHQTIMDRPRLQFQNQFEDGNVALATTRSVEISRGFEHVLCTSIAMDHHAVSLKEMNYLFPLFRYPTEKEAAMGIGKEPNLSPAFLDALASAIGRRFESGGSSGGHGEPFAGGDALVPPNQPALGEFGDGLDSAQVNLVTAPDPAGHPAGPSFSPEDVFHYIYAVLHSPTYRTRYAEFLKIDFPRIPLPGGPEVFAALVPLGAELVSLHLMEHTKPAAWQTTYRGPLDPQVEKVTYANGTVWLDKAQTIGFHGVPENTWNFHIGGYQVCEKWLKDRGPKKGKPGRTLSAEDIEHYHYIVFALTETQRLMHEIDVAIEAHGGWPGAFQGAGTDSES